MPDNVILIGFSGTGKSRVGRALAQRLGWPFVDTDERLVARFGCSISDYFRMHGEVAFREVESEEVRAACALHRHVISLGGGAVMRPENLAAAHRGNLLVRLNAPPATIFRRLTEATGAEERPMLSGEDPRGRIERLLAEREPVYCQAHVTIETDDRTVEQVVEAIVAAMAERVASPATSRT